MVNLETTNWLIGVIAVATAVQTLIILGGAIVGFRLFRQMQATVTDLESRHIEPLRHQVDGILRDVQTIAARVSDQTERVDRAITGTIDRVDETTERVRDSVRDKVAQATGLVRGIRAVITSILTTETTPKPPSYPAASL
jgi:hypothetical protein